MKRLLLLGALMAFGALTIALGQTTPAEAKCIDGVNSKTGKPCGGAGGDANDVVLEIRYEFGALTAGACLAPECTVTTVTATGTVDCGNASCDYISTSVADTFTLPSSLRDLLFATEWRGTAIDPDACFGFETDLGGNVVVSGSAEIANHRLFLRRFDDEETPWRADVGGVALDVLGLEEREYTFNFQGCDPVAGCGAFAEGSMAGDYEGGELIRIDGKGPDKKFDSTPCRCTMSSTPDCPGDVLAPTPVLRIEVTDVTP